MSLSVDPADIAEAAIVLWEIESGEYGVVWTLMSGRTGADHIGTRAQAQAVLDSIREVEKSSNSSILPFPRDIAAS